MSFAGEGGPRCVCGHVQDHHAGSTATGPCLYEEVDLSGLDTPPDTRCDCKGFERDPTWKPR